MKTNNIKWYGWKPDALDHRDKLFATFHERFDTPPPQPAAAVDPKCLPPVWNQGAEGSCTAHGSLVCDWFARAKQVALDAKIMPSRAFQYYNTRLLEHSTSQDAGGQIRDAIKALAKYGVCPESDFPYKVGDFARKPSAANYKSALNDQLLEYSRIPDGNLAAMKRCIADGFPFVFGFAVYKQFESKDCAQSGLVALPPALESPLGGHCVAAIAYDDAKKWQYTGYVRCRNSWGAWGDGGDFWLPYRYFTDAGLASDFWTIRRVE